MTMTADERDLARVLLPGGTLTDEHLSAMLATLREVCFAARDVARDAYYDAPTEGPECDAAMERLRAEERASSDAWNKIHGALEHFHANPEWLLTKHPDAAGTAPKRLATLLRKAGIKLDARWQQAIAQLGAQLGPQVNAGRTYHFELRDEMDWSAGDFGDDGSCFWGERKRDKYALNADERFRAVCFYQASGGEMKGTARVLCIQLDRTSSSDEHDTNAYVIWNAYGIELVTAARVLSHALGYGYRKVGVDGGDIYVNAGGYMLAPHGSRWIAPGADYVSLDVETESEECPNCSDTVEDCGTCGECEQTRCECRCCPDCETYDVCGRCSRCNGCGREM